MIARRMTINGDPVCEIDIRASYLTIYHAHFGAPLDRECDPYELSGFPAEARGVIKQWFVATFGNNGHLERWPREIAADYREKEGHRIGKRYPVKRIREQALEQFPLLEKWGTEDLGWPDLMFIESQAMLGAMRELMGRGIPSLTVHDSLIVAVYKREIAEEALSRHYRKETGADPVLRTHFPLPSEPAMREWSEDDLRDCDAEAESDRSDEYEEPFGHDESEDGDTAYRFHQSDSGETREDDKASAEGSKDDWGWESEEEEDRDEGYTSRNFTAGDSEGEYDEHDASKYF